MSKRSTRSGNDPHADFPVFHTNQWEGMGHLPLLTKVIGAVRGMILKSSPAKAVAKQLIQILQSHWHSRNIYTKTIHYIELMLTGMYTEFMLVSKQFFKGNPSQTTLDW